MVFRLDFVPAGAARREWEQRLAAWYGDCGCAGGVAGALAATIGYILAAYVARWLPAPEGPGGLLWCAGAFASGSVVGKLIGLGNARLRLRAIVRRIERTLQ